MYRQHFPLLALATYRKMSALREVATPIHLEGA
jgi:hypothetical protein